MSWQQLMIRSDVRQLGRFLGYTASSASAVAVFFMFVAFTANPHLPAGESARGLLVAVAVAVAAFGIFFVFYFHTAMLRGRSREFGLLAVLGLAPRQRGRLVFRESLLLALVALISGMLVGAAILPGFLALMVRLLQLPALPATLGEGPVLMTAGVFAALFLFDGWMQRRRMKGLTPLALIALGRTAGKPIAPNLGWAVTGGALLAGGYLIAGAGVPSALQMLAILALVSSGTYLLFSQTLSAALRRRPRPGTSWQAILASSRLSHRIRQSAGMYTVISLLTAGTLVGMGLVALFEGLASINGPLEHPMTLVWVAPDGSPVLGGAVARVLRGAGQSVTGTVTVSGFTASLHTPGRPAAPVAVVSEGRYVRVRSAVVAASPRLGAFFPSLPPLKTGEAWSQSVTTLTNRAAVSVRLRTPLGSYPLKLAGESDFTVLGRAPQLPSELLVVSDATFRALNSGLPATSRWQLGGAWTRSGRVASRIVPKLAKRWPGVPFAGPPPAAEGEGGAMNAVVFFGVFVGGLAMLAIALSLAFRLLAQLPEDVRQFGMLHQLGADRSDVRRIFGRELALLFYLPIGVGVLHGAVAMFDLTVLVGHASFLGYMGGLYAEVVAAYLAAATLRYLALRSRAGSLFGS